MRSIPVGVVLLVVGACAGSDASRSATAGGPLIVFNAGSLARPLRAALDSFRLRSGIEVQQESAGSLETARKLTELGKIPDVIALADRTVFPQLLMPDQVRWYACFARNRMVLAHTARSRFADVINGENWWEIIQRPGVEVGRADPNLDPNGYRTLLAMQLAESHYRRPGLAAALERAAPHRNVRPKEVDLVALLQAGEVDYIWSYESVALAASLPFVRLPDEVDLGTPGDSTFYATASVRVTGATAGDTLQFNGEPILYAASIPIRAPHPDAAESFVRFLLSADGRRILRQARLDALDAAILEGTGAPASIDSVVRRP